MNYSNKKPPNMGGAQGYIAYLKDVSLFVGLDKPGVSIFQRSAYAGQDK
jgi:hypothetical protein